MARPLPLPFDHNRLFLPLANTAGICPSLAGYPGYPAVSAILLPFAATFHPRCLFFFSIRFCDSHTFSSDSVFCFSLHFFQQLQQQKSIILFGVIGNQFRRTIVGVLAVKKFRPYNCGPNNKSVIAGNRTYIQRQQRQELQQYQLLVLKYSRARSSFIPTFEIRNPNSTEKYRRFFNSPFIFKHLDKEKLSQALSIFCK